MHADPKGGAPALPTVPRNTHSPRVRSNGSNRRPACILADVLGARNRLLSQIAAVLPPLAPTPRGIHDATRRLSPHGKQAQLVPDPPRRRPVTQQHPRSSAPPPSMRPSQPVRSDKEECSAVWDEATEAWQITACPALRPTGREQVGHLRACLNRMLQAEQAQRGAGRSTASLDLLQLLDRAPPADLDRQYSALHAIFTAGLHELARQVAINCVERGELLTSLWASSEAIKARLLQRRELDVADTRSNLAALEARCARRYVARYAGLQLGCVGLQHGCMWLQVGCLGLQAGCLWLQVRCGGGASRDDGDIGDEPRPKGGGAGTGHCEQGEARLDGQESAGGAAGV